MINEVDPSYNDKAEHLWRLIKTNFDPSNALIFAVDVVHSTLKNAVKEEDRQEALDEMYRILNERIN